jgi:hypothetical protein
VAEHRQGEAMLIRALREVPAELRAAGETPAKLYDGGPVIPALRMPRQGPSTCHGSVAKC